MGLPQAISIANCNIPNWIGISGFYKKGGSLANYQGTVVIAMKMRRENIRTEVLYCLIHDVGAEELTIWWWIVSVQAKH